MILTILVSLLATQIPLLTTAAPNLKAYSENTGKPSNVISATSSSTQPNPTCLSKTLTSSTPKISSTLMTGAPWNGTLHHSNIGSVSSGSSAFRGSKAGAAIGFKDSTCYSQSWNTSSESSKITVTVANCSQSIQHITLEPKCNCPHLQTTTVFVTVTATATSHPYHTNLGNIGSQILASIPALPHTIALESSLEAAPSISNSEKLSLSSTTTGMSGRPVEQASSSQNVSTQSALSPSFVPTPNPLSGGTMSSKPTMSPTMLPGNDKPLGTIASKSASTTPIGSAMKSSPTSRSCSIKTNFSSLPNPPIPTIVSLQMASLSASLQTTFHPRPGGSTLDLVPTQGQSSYISTTIYPSNPTTLPVLSGSSTGTLLQYSAHNVSLQSSNIESYSGQSFKLPSSMNNYPAPPATAIVPSFTIPPTSADSPNSVIVSPSAIKPPPVESQTLVLPSGSILSSSPLVSMNTAITVPAAKLPNPASPPYPNISQAMNMTTSDLPTGHPHQTYNTTITAQGPHTSLLPHNSSIHPVICLPNTTSTTHIFANYDSRHLASRLPKIYHGLSYTSFALTNQSASMSPPNCISSPADGPANSISVAPAPFISFSLRSIALSCLQAETFSQPPCTILITGTKAAEPLSNGTTTSNQVKRTITVAGTSIGTTGNMMKIDLDGDVEDWTGLKTVSFDPHLDGKPAGLAIDDFEYELKTKGCFFDAEW